MRDYLNKAARYVIDYCIANSIGQLIVGFKPGIKQSINMGWYNNQRFVQIPQYSFKSKLQGLCKRYGILFVKQEESYTSKASSLKLDEMPIYNADNFKDYKL